LRGSQARSLRLVAALPSIDPLICVGFVPTAPDGTTPERPGSDAISWHVAEPEDRGNLAPVTPPWKSSPIGCTVGGSVIFRVEITRLAEKQLRKLPRHIVDNLMIWVAAVEHDGLEEVRKVPGYHDEPLKGDRRGQRSIRLSRAYRAIYEIREDTARFVSVEEVSKHEY
jgi:proteic killer suppression protein